MLCKKAIISSNTSAMPEIIKNNFNGFLVEPNQPSELSSSIEILYNNDELRKKFSNNGYEFVKKNFSIRKMYKKTQQLYQIKK